MKMPWAESERNRFLANLPTHSGVYLMHDAEDAIIYIGKAKNLQRRVSSYFQKKDLDLKTERMVSHIQRIETLSTASEAEALLLEANLIKAHKPRYNILLKDDKALLYFVFSTHRYPRIYSERGYKKDGAKRFGPFPNSLAVREVMDNIQKLFKLRPCSDAFFSHRQRPCLEYQMQRCSAPCVAYIDPEKYAAQCQEALDFLSGKSKKILAEWQIFMQEAAAAHDFEKAAVLRDQIRLLTSLRTRQTFMHSYDNADIVLSQSFPESTLVYMAWIREGRFLGGKGKWLPTKEIIADGDYLHSYLVQFYLQPNNYCPDILLLAEVTQETTLLSEVLSQVCGKRVKAKAFDAKTAPFLRIVQADMDALCQEKHQAIMEFSAAFSALMTAFGWPEHTARIECVDISHTFGSETVASFVVLEPSGFQKTAYRRYRLPEQQIGDDYAALQAAVRKRFDRKRAPFPEVLIVDGGKGQRHRVQEILTAMGSSCLVMGISKGSERKVGEERLWCDAEEKAIDLDNPGHRLLLQLRDEAHRFALALHRKRHAKKQVSSILLAIPGVGKQRRSALLSHFGSLDALRSASIHQLQQVQGISKSLAKRIHQALQLS